MKAVLWTAYGPPEVLRYTEIEKPQPSASEILVRIEAANIFTGDTEARRFKMHPSLWLLIRLYFGLFKPRVAILGQEFSGTIEAVGSEASEFEIGQEVFGNTVSKFGAYAEYIALPAHYPIASKPAEINHIDASTISVGGQHALHFLRVANLRAGEDILIFGAGGCIGTYAVQLAKLRGAHVTAVDSEDKLAMLSELGADRVIDYEKEDFTRASDKYDVIFDIVGKSPYKRSLNRLNAAGRYVLANVGLTPILRAIWTTITSDKKVISEFARANKADLEELADLMREGKITAAIDRTYPLEKTVEAHRYIDTGRKRGHVVLHANNSANSDY